MVMASSFIHLAGVSSLLGAVNFLTTFRSPPLAPWTRPALPAHALVVTVRLLLRALPVLAGRVTMLLRDRLAGGSF